LIGQRHKAALGFDAIAPNSLDAASDRDFVCELAFILSLTAVHLSQWAEEWIIYSTDEFGFLNLPEGILHWQFYHASKD
jgi:argininosuccinate lyase